ncbi:hypothetical protein ACQ4PT_024864 [Festuca glaucescens]
MASSVRGGGRGGGAGAEETAPRPLPPPPRLAAAMSSSSPASIRALLSRTAGGGADCQQSPRSLLSRILLRGGDHHGGNGGGGGGGTFGCRVRLPRRYSSTSSASSVGGGARKDDGSAASEQSADDVGSAARVKVVERAPELLVDTPRSSLGRKKPEEELMSMNLGLGASLVLLLSKSAVELNRMVELRAQMEALASEMRQMTPGNEKQGAAAPAASSTTSSQESTVIKDPIAAEDALSDNCSGARTADRRAVAVMDHSQMEAELQVELGRLQMQHRAVHVEKRAIAPPMQGLELPPLQVKTKNHVPVDSPSRSCVDDGDVVQGNAEEDEEDDDEEEEYDDEDDDLSEGHGAVLDGNSSPPHGGVSARALERRLHELLQRRQQDRIVQLEAALDGAQRRLQEREREVVWWRDAAKLVSHRRDESRRLRCTAAS